MAIEIHCHAHAPPASRDSQIECSPVLRPPPTSERRGTHVLRGGGGARRIITLVAQQNHTGKPHREMQASEISQGSTQVRMYDMTNRTKPAHTSTYTRAILLAAISWWSPNHSRARTPTNYTSGCGQQAKHSSRSDPRDPN